MTKPSFDYRFRFILHAVIYMLGFWSPWVYVGAIQNVAHFSDRSTWIVLATLVYHTGLLTFPAAVDVLLVIALLLTGLGAWLRTWGSAYVGASVVQSREMHSETMLADGPYRRTRNPLYLGTLLHTLGVALIMPPSGAIFAIVLLWFFQVRLALAEEPYLTERFGAAYVEYKARVPRFLPSLTPLVPAAGQKPRWGQAVAGELYFIGTVVVFAVFGWSFNATPIRQGLLISLGLWFIARAFTPVAKAEASEGATSV